MPSVILTDIYVSQLKSKNKQFEVCDTKVRGLTIRVSRDAKAFNCIALWDEIAA